MELSNEFEVGVPIAEAWAVLTDVETIAPCLPGAQLQEIADDGDGHKEYLGVVKVKVGPITAQYKGSARFASKDDDNFTAILSAAGRDTRGQGTANATITATLLPKGDAATAVSVVTELNLTGKVAQFGRGVLGDVSKKLLDQFVENLEASVLQGGTDRPPDEGAEPEPENASPLAESVAAPEDRAPTSRLIDSADVAPVDLIDAAGTPVLKRALPLLGVAAATLIVVRLIRRRRRG